jgi:hypothetical protein
MNIYQRINAVRKAVKYVQKDKDVSTGKGSYKAVTHDMVTAMVRAHMIEHGIVCFPSLVESSVATPPKSKDGTESSQIRYEATYDFHFVNEAAPEDKIVVRIQAHAMDNADKAPGKAISYAKKYAVLKLFEIETGEDEESRMHEPEQMPEKMLADFIASLDGATNAEELKNSYLSAYRAAQALDDKSAQAAITRAKDSRKAALSKKAAA